MGGVGSGRRTYATTPTVEQSFQIDADDLTDGVDHPGDARGRREWRPEHFPDVDLTVHFEAAEDADRTTHVRLEYEVRPVRGEDFQESHPVRIVYTEPNYGGVRPWFRCPGVVDGEKCGSRVRKLYLPNGGEYWLCRECYGLGYTSSRASGDDLKQAELRYRRAFAKADRYDRRPHPNNAPMLPEKPKGMHYDTFDRLMQDVRDARESWDDEMARQAKELMRNLSSTEMAAPGVDEMARQ